MKSRDETTNPTTILTLKAKPLLIRVNHIRQNGEHNAKPIFSKIPARNGSECS